MGKKYKYYIFVMVMLILFINPITVSAKNNILLGDIIAIHPTKILYMEYNEFLFVLKNDSIFLEN